MQAAAGACNADSCAKRLGLVPAQYPAPAVQHGRIAKKPAARTLLSHLLVLCEQKGQTNLGQPGKVGNGAHTIASETLLNNRQPYFAGQIALKLPAAATIRLLAPTTIWATKH